MKNELKAALAKYLPAETVDSIANSIVNQNVAIRITRARATKLGDFRPSLRGGRHRISVNGNLNPYSFLITFVHEWAHLLVFQKYGRKVKPHGEEWKNTYRQLMQIYFDQNVFPSPLRNVLFRSVQKARATDTGDADLSSELKKFDPITDSHSSEVELSQLADGSYFIHGRQRVFQKLHLRRKRYKCLCVASKRLYLFSPVATVVPASTEEVDLILKHVTLTKSKR